MKTIALKLAFILVTLLGLNSLTFAAGADSQKVSTTVTEVRKVNKIEVYGNVQVYVSSGDTDMVKVYNQYYKESALVQGDNGTLRIASYKNEKLVVWVTASDLRKIELHDNAEIKSFGKLSAISLDVELSNNAVAKLDMDAFEANVTLNDRAKAYLAGNIETGALKCDRLAILNTASLALTDHVKITSAGNDALAENLVSL